MKPLLYASVATLALTASGAFANETLNSILSSDAYAGATVLEARSSIFGIEVEAVLPDGSRVERRYRPDGSLRKEEIVAEGIETENRYGPDGTLVSSESEPVDDDEDEDDDDRDDDDDEDEDEDDSRDDDDDDDDEDEGDDDDDEDD